MVVCLHNRPPLERFRVLCTYCLVFDAIFTLIFALSGLSSSAYSVETSCYEQNGYSWHNILALSFIVSSVFAAWGGLIHGGVVVSGEGSPLKPQQLVGVSRYGHVLVAWTFLAAVLEAIATREQPLNCSVETQSVIAEPSLGDLDNHALTKQHVGAIWQMASTILWLIWVIGAVAAAMSAKRNLPYLQEGQARQSEETTDNNAQMVGIPVQDEELPSGTVVGVATPALGGPAPTFQPTFQGMPVGLPVDGVCQGRPVRDETGDVSRPAGAPKEA
ncbi:unnamed protein product [Effrenium voratum]|nr:unnamed protein product [Effrenium voratum]